MASYWLQLDLDLLDSPRWMGLNPWTRHLYIALVKRCVHQECGELVRAGWTDRVALSLIGAMADDHPPSCAEMLAELAGPACHLIDLTEDSISIHGFSRYKDMIEGARRIRSMNAERQRRKRERDRGISPAPEAPESDVTEESRVTECDDVRDETRDTGVTDASVTREKRDVTLLDVDVDVDVIQTHIKSPPLTGCVPVTERPEEGTAGKAHMAPLNGKPPATEDGPRPFEQEASEPLPWMDVTRETRDRFKKWVKLDGGKFRMKTQLQRLIRERDGNDPVTLLAHVLEVDVLPGANDPMALLYARLHPKEGEAAILPADEKLEEAKTLVNGDTAKRGGPAEKAFDAAVSALKVDDPDDDPCGGLASPAAGLQDRLDSKQAKRDEPPGADPEPQKPILTRSQRRQRKADAEEADIPEPILNAYNGLTSGWSFPGDTNHESAKRSARALLAGDAIKALAYVDQVNRTAVIRGDDPWEKLAEMCRELPDPDEPGNEKALTLLRGMSHSGKGGGA